MHIYSISKTSTLFAIRSCSILSLNSSSISKALCTFIMAYCISKNNFYWSWNKSSLKPIPYYPYPFLLSFQHFPRQYPEKSMVDNGRYIKFLKLQNVSQTYHKDLINSILFQNQQGTCPTWKNQDNHLCVSTILCGHTLCPNPKQCSGNSVTACLVNPMI